MTLTIRTRILRRSVFVVLATLAWPGVAIPQSDLREVHAVETVRLPLPTNGVRGLHWAGNQLWLLVTSNVGLSAPDESYVSRLMIMDTTSGEVETVGSERDGYETGLAFDGEYLWSGGSLLGEREGLYQIDPASRQVVLTLPGSGYHPAGLAWDGSYLWQVDADARKLYRLEIEEGKISRKIKTPGFYPTGLTYDGFHFWTADASSGRLYRLKGHNGRADAVVHQDSFYRPGDFVSLAWDGRALWAAGAQDSSVVRLELMQ